MIDMKTAENSVARSLDSSDKAIHHTGRGLGNTLDHVGPALHHTADRITDIAQQGLDAMRSGTGELNEQVREASRKTASYIRHDPIKSVLIAAAVGAGAMALCGLLRQNHGPDKR